MQITHRILVCILASVTVIGTTAQTRKQLIKARVDSALTARYYRSPYDTNYVVRPEGTLTLKVRLNQSGNTFHAKGTIEGIDYKSDLETSRKTTVSLGASYRGISVALALNPEKLSGAYKDYELNLNYYSSRFSLDFSYQRSETLAGDIFSNDNLEKLEAGEVLLKIVNLAGYYTFNHRRFSYPAAFTQSYIQRRSAGSWLAGISYQGGTIRTSDDLKANNPDVDDIRLRIGHIGIGGGYGYNWVLGKRKQWLLHFSILPTVVVYNYNKMTVNDEPIDAQSIRLNMLFNERLAIVYNISSRYFAGITGVMNNSVFKDSSVTINQNKWRARASFGVRL